MHARRCMHMRVHGYSRLGMPAGQLVHIGTILYSTITTQLHDDALPSRRPSVDEALQIVLEIHAPVLPLQQVEHRISWHVVDVASLRLLWAARHVH